MYCLYYLSLLALTNLKNVPLDTPIIDAASVLVISWLIYLSNISLVLGGVTTLDLPNQTPFSFAVLIPSVCLSFIEDRNVITNVLRKLLMD